MRLQKPRRVSYAGESVDLCALKPKNSVMANDNSESSTKADGWLESQPASGGSIVIGAWPIPMFGSSSQGMSSRRSVSRLAAGSCRNHRSRSGSALQARIAKKGFFMFRVNEDQTRGTELTDLPSPSQGGTEVEGD